MTFARSITLPPPTATITSGSTDRAERDGGVDRGARDVDDGVGEDRDVERGQRRRATVAKPGRAGDDRVGDDEDAAAVARGDAAGGGGHPGPEEHLRGRA